LTTVELTLGGNRTLVAQPDGSEQGRMSVDMLTALARARRTQAAACFLRPPVLRNEALFELTTTDVPRVRPSGLSSARAEWCWQMAEWRDRIRMRAATASSSFSLEWYRELRRQASDERLPIDLRGKLREGAHRWYDRAERGSSAAPRFARAALRDPIAVQLPGDLQHAAEQAAIEAGVPTGASCVAVDVHDAAEVTGPALDWLATRGFSPFVLGGDPLVDVFVLLTCRFLICDASDAQRTAYLTNTPTLTINATDAYTFYPVRADGIYVVKTAIDLDSGDSLSPRDLLGEAFYRNQRNCGFRNASAADVSAAVEEMVDGLERGWSETAAQARYRELAIQAGTAMTPRVRHLAKWGPVDGFIGDGRIARVQAERTS
jgi:hypothetical protein